MTHATIYFIGFFFYFGFTFALNRPKTDKDQLWLLVGCFFWPILLLIMAGAVIGASLHYFTNQKEEDVDSSNKDVKIKK